MTSLKTSIKTITYLSDIGCLEIQGASLISAFANYAVQTENWQQNALQALRSDKKGLTPEKLLVLQDHVLNYNVEVSLVGTLARKIVAAVETLTRS
ncbi:type III secretion system inner rod subunit SctI [Escherichia coli]|uniref:type III secretion system inner rod subunit SctI n=1 Tax=Escherichia coli TaxID=562 RepID=UPI003BF4E186